MAGQKISRVPGEHERLRHPVVPLIQAHSIWQQTSPNTSQCSFNPCLKETVSSLAPKRNAKDSNLLLRLSRIIFCLWFTHVRHNVVDDVVRFSFLTIISRHRSETNCVFLPQQKNLKKIWKKSEENLSSCFYSTLCFVFFFFSSFPHC